MGIRGFRQAHRVRDFDELLEVGREFVRKTKGTDLQNSPGGPLDVHVNHGRWIADCPCGNSVVCDPDEKRALCLECGFIHNVRFPKKADRDRAEAALLERRVEDQNWYPDRERPHELDAENAALRAIGRL